MSTSAYLIFGNDEYRVSARAKEIVASHLSPGEQAFGLETVDGAVDTIDAALAAISRCVEGVTTVGMFGGKKLVWFRDVSFLSETQTGKSETVKTRLEDVTSAIKAGLPKDHLLLITSPAVDKRYAFFKACKALCDVQEFSVPEQSRAAESQASEQLDDVLGRFGIKMNSDVREAFLERVGIDTRHIANEVEKLSVYLGKEHEAGHDDVSAIVCASRESKGWDLSDAFGKKDLAKALEIVRRLTFQQESPFMMIAMLQNRIKDLMIFRQAADAGWLTLTDTGRGGAVAWREVPPDVEQVFSEVFDKDPRSMHPYRAFLLASQAKQFSYNKLLACQRIAIESHEKMVSSALPDDMILELMLIQMLS